jgi:branched-chain amino acid transport system substrate-binding protein
MAKYSNRRVILRGLTLGCLLTAAFLAGCNGEKTAKVVAVLPLTGQYALYGKPIEQGIELAHSQIVEGGEYPYNLALEVLDSGSDPAKAAELLAQAYEDGALVAIGGVTSAEALAMVPVADEAERTLLSPSASSPELSGASRHFYRIYPSDLREGTKMGNFAAQQLELDNVVVLSSDSDFARGISRVFETEFERNQGTPSPSSDADADADALEAELAAADSPAASSERGILEEIVYPEGTEDFSEVLDRVIALRPQAVYVADFAEPVRNILAGLKERGFRGTLLTTSAFASPEVVRAAGENAESVIVTQVQFDAEDPAVRAFADAYEQAYGSMPGIYAAHGYDAMKVVAQAIASAGLLPSETWKGFRGLNDFVGVTGNVQFDERGDVGKFPRVYILQNGVFEDYDSVMAARREELQKRLEELRRQREEALRRVQ